MIFEHVAGSPGLPQAGIVSLRTRAVQREAAQGAAAAGEECRAQRHFAAGERLLQSDAQVVGPDDSLADVFVVRRLPKKLREAEVRAQPIRADAHLVVHVNAAMRVEHVVARVVHPAGGHGRQMHVQLVSRNQVRDEQVADAGQLKVVAEEQVRRLLLIQRTLQLITDAADAIGEDRIFCIVLSGENCAAVPYFVPKNDGSV